MRESAKSKSEIYIKLYELERETLNKRRDIEWKVCISLWSAILVTTSFLYGNFPLTRQTQIYSLIFYILIFIVFAIVWLGRMFYSNEINHCRIESYKSHIEYFIGYNNLEPAPYIEPTKYCFLKSAWWWSQFFITGLIFSASWCILFLQMEKICNN
jgi:hypothetical protein